MTDRVEGGEGRPGTLYPAAFLLAVLLLAGVFLVAVPPSMASRSLPVDFDHSRHVRRGLACADCHQGVLSGARAVIPREDLCRLCHSRPVLGTEGEARLLKSLAPGREPVQWPNPRFLPDHVIFSHRRHVGAGGIACDRCHGPVADSTSLPSMPTAGHLDMDACMACHKEEGARSDCFDCHR